MTDLRIPGRLDNETVGSWRIITERSNYFLGIEQPLAWDGHAAPAQAGGQLIELQADPARREIPGGPFHQLVRIVWCQNRTAATFYLLPDKAHQEAGQLPQMVDTSRVLEVRHAFDTSTTAA